MTAGAFDLDLIAAAGDVVANALLGVELSAHLVEIGDLEIGAALDTPLLRFQLAEQELEQRALARAIGSDDADLVAAQDQRREITDDGLLTPALGEALGLDHQLARAIRLAQPDARRTLEFAPLTTLLAHGFERAHPTLVTSAPCLDALPDPDLFLRELAVEVRIGLRLGMEPFLAPAQIVGVIARPVGQPAAIEFQDARGDPLQEAPVVGDEQQCALKTDQEFFQPGDAVDVEMVGRLVEQQQIRLHHQGARQHHPPLHPARERLELRLAIESEPRDDALGALLDLPAALILQLMLKLGQPCQILLARVGSQRMRAGEILVHQRAQLAEPGGHHLEDAGIDIPRHLLRQPPDPQPLTGVHPTAVGLNLPGDDPQQCGLARPIAPDQTDPLAALDGEGDLIEQGRQAVGETDRIETEQGHAFSRESRRMNVVGAGAGAHIATA